ERDGRARRVDPVSAGGGRDDGRWLGGGTVHRLVGCHVRQRRLPGQTAASATGRRPLRPRPAPAPTVVGAPPTLVGVAADPVSLAWCRGRCAVLRRARGIARPARAPARPYGRDHRPDRGADRGLDLGRVRLAHRAEPADPRRRGRIGGPRAAAGAAALPGALALAALVAVSPAAIPAATFGTLHVAEWRRFAEAAAVGAAGVVAGAIQGLWRPFGGLPYIWWLVIVISVEAALVGWGQLTQARRALIVSLRERARRAEAEQGRRVAEARAAERTRIAREMHDVLAHRLSLLATYAGAIEYRPDAPPEQVARAAGV